MSDKVLKTDKHTPFPWHLGEGAGLSVVFDEGLIVVADCDPMRESTTPRGVANAAFILKACSCHDELVEALKCSAKLVEIARQYFPESMHSPSKFQLENTCASIGKAIAKAEGR